jgi:hypothetical protein
MVLYQSSLTGCAATGLLKMVGATLENKTMVLDITISSKGFYQGCGDPGVSPCSMLIQNNKFDNFVTIYSAKIKGQMTPLETHL